MKGGSSADLLSLQDSELLGEDEDRLPSNAADEPVPVLLGTGWLGVKFLDGLLEVEEEPVYQETKKDPVQSGVLRRGTTVGLFCQGPVDAIHEIRLDNQTVWVGPVFRGSEHYVDITIEDRGTLRLYWGTSGQPQDGLLPDHPRYRNICYGIWIKLLWGYNRTNMPQAKVKLSLWPQKSYIAGKPNVLGDCNVAAIVGHLVQDPYLGPTWENGRVDTTALGLLAVSTANSCLGLSLVLDRTESLETLLARINDHVGGYVDPTASGIFSYQLLREPATWTGVPHVHEGNLLEEPRLDGEKTEETYTKVHVVYTNLDRGGKGDFTTYNDPAARRTVGENRPTTVERRFITRHAMAVAYAASFGPMLCNPTIPGRVKVKASVGRTINPGAVFRLSYGHLGFCGLPCRCVTRTIPSPTRPEIEIEFEVDRSYLSMQHAPPSDYVPPTRPEFPVEPIQAGIMSEPPAGLRYLGDFPRVLALARKPPGLTSNFQIYTEKSPDSYAAIGSAKYARHGRIVTNPYPVTAPWVDTQVRMRIQLLGEETTLPNTTWTSATINEWLLFAGEEIFSFFDADLVSPGVYDLSLIRSRYDSRAVAHPVGEEVWIIQRSSLVTSMLPDNRTNGKAKLRPLVTGGTVDLADIDPIIFTTTRRNILPLAPSNVRLYGNADPGRGRFYRFGEGVQVEWTPVVGFEEKGDYWATANEFTKGHFVAMTTTAGAVMNTWRVGPGARSQFISWTDHIEPFFPAGDDFLVRVFAERDGFTSRLYGEGAIYFQE